MMELKKSPLMILNFIVINSTFNTIQAKSEKEMQLVDLYKHPVEVDFGINDLEDDIKALFMKVSSNNGDDPEEGYSFFVEAVTFYKLTDTKLDQKIKDNLLGFSIVGMAYSNIRGFIENISGQFPLGRYYLPSVDLIDLVNTKMKSLKDS